MEESLVASEGHAQKGGEQVTRDGDTKGESMRLVTGWVEQVRGREEWRTRCEIPTQTAGEVLPSPQIRASWKSRGLGRGSEIMSGSGSLQVAGPSEGGAGLEAELWSHQHSLRGSLRTQREAEIAGEKRVEKRQDPEWQGSMRRQ